MSVASQVTGVANAVSHQINPVNIVYWVFIPIVIGIALCVLILAIWQPKFSGTYDYTQCEDAKTRKNCVTKKGSVRRNEI